MPDEQDVKRRIQGRSPPFPFIPLERALQRVQEFADYSKGHPIRAVSALSGAWKYNPKSSGGVQTIGALRGYGLIADSGSGSERRIQLSDLAKRLLRNPPPHIRQALLKEAALNPKLIQEYWGVWKNDRPPDDECLWMLQEERGLTSEAAARFLSVYDATIRFAGLADSDSMSASEEDMETDMLDDSSEEEAPMRPDPIPAPRRSPAVNTPTRFSGGGSIPPVGRTPAAPEWEERLRDRSGLEIVIQFSGEPTQATYEYIRDYINFKFGLPATGSAVPAASAQSATSAPPAPASTPSDAGRGEAGELRATTGLQGAAASTGAAGLANDAPARSEPPQEEPTISTQASVPFMITASQRVRLQQLGYSTEQLRHMTPPEAHKILSGLE